MGQWIVEVMEWAGKVSGGRIVDEIEMMGRGWN